MSTTGGDAPSDMFTQYYGVYKVSVYGNLFTGIIYGEGQ